MAGVNRYVKLDLPRFCGLGLRMYFFATLELQLKRKISHLWSLGQRRVWFCRHDFVQMQSLFAADGLGYVFGKTVVQTSNWYFG